MTKIQVETGFQEYHGKGIVWCGKDTKRVSLASLLRHIELHRIEFTESVPAVEDGKVIGHARKVIGSSAWVVYLD
jgi:hypothetical protein